MAENCDDNNADDDDKRRQRRRRGDGGDCSDDDNVQGRRICIVYAIIYCIFAYEKAILLLTSFLIAIFKLLQQ
uniref:Uncharacterized protein n=1 Tax=Syphacia muris TaxID=451379 RepID=A0A0N5AH50_9BILA